MNDHDNETRARHHAEQRLYEITAGRRCIICCNPITDSNPASLEVSQLAVCSQLGCQATLLDLEADAVADQGDEDIRPARADYWPGRLMHHQRRRRRGDGAMILPAPYVFVVASGIVAGLIVAFAGLAIGC